MNRKHEGLPIALDTTVWTVDLNREELVVILDGIRRHRINRAKKRLQQIRARKSRTREKRSQ